ncbi:unnamed protein product [Rhizoctonia solani]|uniref:BAG domain-containing protein n=1 Tax=Rhizoctonia solani TaxID=456999 RepID=A0A8H3C950_9AGAM|nr:unnamed protein product [Rhizoctonia solani]
MTSKSCQSTRGSPTKYTYSYEFASEYVHPPTQPTPVPGYPYMPHNATTQEREACITRINAIRARSASHSQPVQFGAPKPEAYRVRAEAKAGGVDTPAGKSSSPEPAADVHSSSEEDDSNGPDTPYSPERFIWKDSADDAPEQEYLDHPHTQGKKVYYGSYKYYPPAPPVVPEQEHTTESASDNFTTAASAAARKELQQLTYEFNNLVLAFKFPRNLEFTVPPNQGGIPKLAHTPASKPLLEHNHKLEKLLEKLDAIESNGDKEIQRLRKQAVGRMLSELEGLKRMEAMALYNFNYERGAKA